MNIDAKQKNIFREILKNISTVISWTIFVLLLICAAFLLYYFIATRIYAASGSKNEPKFSLYTIISGSMTPNINVYDVVIDVRVDNPEEIEIGDVITFYSDLPAAKGRPITHRVISIIKDKDGNYSYQTKGDFNPIEDEGTVPFEKVVGKVALKIPQLGRVQTFLASSMGWLCLILIPALYILLKALLRFIKNKKYPELVTSTNEIISNVPEKVKNIEKKTVIQDNTLSFPNIGLKQEKNTFINDDDNEELNLPKLKPLYERENDDIGLEDLPRLK